MGDNCGPGRFSNNAFAIPRSDPKSMAGQKRGVAEIEERSELGQQKRVKMRDLESVFCSEIGTPNPNYWKNKQATDHSAENDMSQVTKETVTMNWIASQLEISGKDTSQVVVGPAYTALDLNTKVDMVSTNSEVNIEKSRGFGFDLNAGDHSSSLNHDLFYHNKHQDHLKFGEASECGSTCAEEKDPMQVWKKMKQNGFMSSSYGGLPIPKPQQRGRKSKADGLKKKMEIARKEQVDRFAKVAAPTGLLNGLNPGIINHVRNSKQVHSIIEALVRSERRQNSHTENKHEEEKIQMKTGRIEDTKNSENLNMSGMNRYNNLYHQDCFPHTLSGTNNCPMGSVHIGGDFDSSIVEKRVFDKKNFLSYSIIENEEDILALKLSSSATMPSENRSSLSNEGSANLSSVSSLSVKAANVASQWLELLHQDIKGRLAALRRSKKRVRAVIQTELPFLMSREFSHNQENDPYAAKNSVTGFMDNGTAEAHRARWSALFDQMEKALSEEEKQLENLLNQVNEMQLHCDHGLFQCTGAPGMQQLGASENDRGLEKVNDSERDLAVRAAAAAFYSTCNFLQSMENLPCFS